MSVLVLVASSAVNSGSVTATVTSTSSASPALLAAFNTYRPLTSLAPLNSCCTATLTDPTVVSDSGRVGWGGAGGVVSRCCGILGC